MLLMAEGRGTYNSHKRPDMKKLGDKVNFIFTWRRMNKNTFMELQTPESVQLLPQSITRGLMRFGNIKEDDAPLLIPARRQLKLHIFKLELSETFLALFSDHQKYSAVFCHNINQTSLA